MEFKQVERIFFTYSNEKNKQYNKNILLRSLNLYKEYTVLFMSTNVLKSTSYIELILHSNSLTESHLIKLNKSYKFVNKDISSIEININLHEDILFNIRILEKPILFKENTYENSDKLKQFISNIDNQKLIPSNNNFKSKLKIACILDEFTYNCISYEANCIQLKSMTWLKQIKEFKPDILLVESAWYGICKTWIRKVASSEKIDTTISDLINFCKKNYIPTIFFNKEGLTNFNYFEKNSSLFDYIFVTDENIITHQVNSCSHNNIYPLSFACQPKIHNSINKNKFKLGDIAFAGGWYGDRHIDRITDFNYIIKPALKYNLDIFDRNYHQRSILEFTNNYWPTEYINNIVGKLDYKYMVEAYKNYTLFLNVNSVQDSSYMVSRRVYEILACKTLLLSSYSKGIDKNFKDYVFISKSKEETTDIIDKIIVSSNTNYEKFAKKSQRYILENHTYKHRLCSILDCIDFNFDILTTVSVGLIYIIKNANHSKEVFEMIMSQTYKISHIHLIIDSNIDITSYLDFIKNKNIDYKTYTNSTDIDYLLKEIYNSNNFISYYAICSSENFYGKNYIRDYVNILSYTNTNLIGKSRIYKFKDNKLNLEICDFKDSYVNRIYYGTLFMSKDFLNEFKYSQYLNEDFLSVNQSLFYSDDEFNFIKDAFLGNIINKKNIDFIEI